jgi:hypothetical protein
LYYKGLAEAVSTGPKKARLERLRPVWMVRRKKSATKDGGAKAFPPQEEVDGK